MSQKVFNGNNIELLKEYPDNYFDAIVTDPPYGLGKEPNAEQMLQAWITDGYLEVKGSGFMGKEWDAFVPQPIFWKEVFRVLKPGGHILSFFGTRTYDWGVMAMRLAGFEVRDCINWVYGSGFPKSHNIGKNIEKIKVGGIKNLKKVGEKKGIKVETGTQGFSYSQEYVAGKSMGGKQISGNIPIYEITNEWEGWGSALKPAHEDIVLARKPLEKGLSIAENVLKWGTGGINIDGCRIKVDENDPNHRHNPSMSNQGENSIFGVGGHNGTLKNEGRFPANLILSHSNYQVMNLVGNIDNLILAEIIRYFYGYTKVSDLRQRKRSSTKQDKCGDEVLQSGLQKNITKEGFDTQENTSNLSELRNSICSNERSLPEWEKEVLHTPLQRPTSKTIEGGKSNKVWEEAYGGIKKENGRNENKERNDITKGKASELERGENESSWICEHNDFNTSDGLAENSKDDATKTNLHFGTQNSDGNGIEKTSIGFGECSSHQRNKERQHADKFSNRGQGESFKNTSENRCGNGSIKEREPILEVLDFDIPAEWLQYFEYTGEQLGCVCVGTKKVKPSNGSGKASGTNNKFNNGVFQDENREGKFVEGGYGEETIENWNCHEDCPIRIMDEQSGVSKGENKLPYSYESNEYKVEGFINNVKPQSPSNYNDKGGASRFFYCAKASKKERNKGLEGFEEKSYSDLDKIGGEKSNFKTGSGNERNIYNKNFHPTVKPISLMRYLVRLITPPNGIVLDPFNGSGTTGIACKLEGMNYVGMELDAEYCKIAQARIDNFTESDLEHEVEELNEDAQTNESEQKDNEDDNLDTQLSLF